MEWPRLRDIALFNNFGNGTTQYMKRGMIGWLVHMGCKGKVFITENASPLYNLQMVQIMRTIFPFSLVISCSHRHSSRLFLSYESLTKDNRQDLSSLG